MSAGSKIRYADRIGVPQLVNFNCNGWDLESVAGDGIFRHNN
jgi:hypothetical protein